jgi:hypothetical protein
VLAIGTVGDSTALECHVLLSARSGAFLTSVGALPGTGITVRADAAVIVIWQLRGETLGQDRDTRRCAPGREVCW